VGIGTDSVVSVGRLDLLAEARAARRLAGLSGEAALALLTIGGARAIGLEDEVGSLVPGTWGDLTVIQIGPAAAPADAIERVLHSEREDVVATYIGGRLAYRRTGS
jgi:5-methylthioadenosine/S-adenosylhomocysteine deaminase